MLIQNPVIRTQCSQLFNQKSWLELLSNKFFFTAACPYLFHVLTLCTYLLLPNSVLCHSQPQSLNNRYILNRMKKREASSKSLKPRQSSPATKKAAKSKSHPKQPRKDEEYLILGDQFYIARTQAERHIFQQFEKQAKSRPVALKKVPKKSSLEFQPMNLQEYVKSLSKAEKEQLLLDLEKQMQPEKEQGWAVENETEQKLGKLNVKLETIRSELMRRWQEQINKITQLFENEQIGLEDKNEKIRLVQKIRNNKLAMIDHIRLLFNRIMLDDRPPHPHPHHIDHIISSLGSLNSLYSLCHNEPPASTHSPFQSEIPPISTHQDIQKKSQPHQDIEEYETIQREFFHEESPNQQQTLSPSQQQAKSPSEQQSVSPSQQRAIEPLEIQPFSRQQLKLEIRLDEVQFGRDHYDEEPNLKDTPACSGQHGDEEVLGGKLEKGVAPAEKLGVELSSDKKQLQEQFLCRQQPMECKLKIPLLMTKDRLEQMELEKTAKEKQLLALAIKSRMSYQVSQAFPQAKEHFTTLYDVNTFVVSFYEFIMQRFLKEVIEGLNLAYGKCSLDKLFQLNRDGIVIDTQNNVLLQEMLEMFHQQISLNVRKLSQHQKSHNRAVFTLFNLGLNVYRPYYELQGDLFPWNTSEKGLTFYEISDQNIEQVFEKSKITVLEHITNLCGIMPLVELTTAQAQRQLQKRNEECYERVLKAEIKQKFGEWYIKVLNYEALERLNLCRAIIEDQLDLFCQELLRMFGEADP